MIKSMLLAALLGIAAVSQLGCAAVAGGVAGAVIVHEIVEDDD